jgi:multiple sugar transport system substrate-binding protein
MSYKKSKFLSTMLAMASLTMVAACANNQASSTTDTVTQTATTQPTTEELPADLHDLKADVTFWHTIGKANLDKLNTMITAFNAIYPDINISTVSQGGYDQLKDTISNAIPAGTTPTMAYCYPDHVAEYLAAGAVLKLDDFISNPRYGLGVDNGLGDKGKDDFVQTYWNEGNNYTIDGVAKEGVYSVPFSKSTEVLFYNKKQFDAHNWAVPKTWDQMWKLCADIRTAYPDKNTDGSYKVNPFGYDSDANWYITLSQQKKIAYTSGTGTSHYLFANDDAKSMVTDLKAKYDLGYFKTQATLGAGTYTSTKFTSGDIMMSIGSTGGTTHNYTESFDTGVAALPQADVDNGKVIMQGPSMCFFSRSTLAQKVGAWLFYKFITNTKNSAIWSVETGYNPVRTSSFSDPIYTNRDTTTGSKALVKKVSDFLADSTVGYSDFYFTSPAFKGSSTARVEMGNLMGAVMLGTKTVDKAFADAMSNCLFAS